MSFSKLLYISDSCTLSHDVYHLRFPVIYEDYVNWLEKVMQPWLDGRMHISPSLFPSVWLQFSWGEGGALQHPTQSQTWSSEETALSSLPRSSVNWCCYWSSFHRSFSINSSLPCLFVHKPTWSNRLVASPNFPSFHISLSRAICFYTVISLWDGTPLCP